MQFNSCMVLEIDFGASIIILMEIMTGLKCIDMMELSVNSHASLSFQLLFTTIQYTKWIIWWQQQTWTWKNSRRMDNYVKYNLVMLVWLSSTKKINGSNGFSNCNEMSGTMIQNMKSITANQLLHTVYN